MPISSGWQSRTICRVFSISSRVFAGIAKLEEEADLQPAWCSSWGQPRRSAPPACPYPSRPAPSASPTRRPPTRSGSQHASGRRARQGAGADPPGCRHLKGICQPSDFSREANWAASPASDRKYRPRTRCGQAGRLSCSHSSSATTFSACANCSAGPRSVWRTSCSEMGSRGW